MEFDLIICKQSKQLISAESSQISIPTVKTSIQNSKDEGVETYNLRQLFDKYIDKFNLNNCTSNGLHSCYLIITAVLIDRRTTRWPFRSPDWTSIEIQWPYYKELWIVYDWLRARILKFIAVDKFC